LSESNKRAFISSLSLREAKEIDERLSFWLRPEQHAPSGTWRIWRPRAEKIFPLTRRLTKIVRPKSSLSGTARTACASGSNEIRIATFMSSVLPANPVPSLSWETNIPIATHPVLLANFGLLFAVAGALVGALLAFILAMTGGGQIIEPMVEWTATLAAAAFLLTLIVSIVIFGNRLHIRFALDPSGAEAEVIDQRPKIAARAVAAFSWLADRFGLAGAGLIAEASAPQHIEWDQVADAHFHPLWRTISLSNGWHIALILFCSAENYDAVAAAVHTGLAARHPHTFHNPLPALLLRTFLVLLSSMPLFAMPFAEKDGVFPALLVLGFGLAAVWLSARLAWVVLACVAWLGLIEFIAVSEPRDSLFGGTYRAYQVLNMSDAITLGLVASGALCLILLSLGLIAGHWRSGLSANRVERGRSPLNA
jgi:hypothetical protein